MGLCASSQPVSEAEAAAKQIERQRTKEVDQELNKIKVKDQLVNKLLLLGAGGSGKSTLFKQMIKIYGTGFTEAERRQYTNVIYNNIITSIQVLLTNSEIYGAVSPQCQPATHFMSGVKEGEALTMEHIGHLKALWADAGIQQTYANRSKFQLNDSTDYFMQRLDDVCGPNYIPTEADVLRSRVPTTGIVENDFVIEGSPFKMFDVGGQRSERKKWIHCFENVTAVLFVAAISEFDQVLYEDEHTNRMVESLSLFEEISNSHYFSETSMILFLNKRDLFEEKLKTVKFSDFWPDYQGPNECEPLVDWIKKLFLKQNNAGSHIYVHVTCATDSDNVAFVFEAVKDIVIKSGLKRAGLV